MYPLYNVEINGDFPIPVSKLDYDMVSVGDKIVIRSFMESAVTVDFIKLKRYMRLIYIRLRTI